VLQNFFSALLKSGITDLIEIPKARRLKQPDENRLLRDCASDSHQRCEKLRKLISDQDWNLVLRKPLFGQVAVGAFLDTFLIEEELGFGEGNNLAVFYDQRPKDGWSGPLKESRNSDRSGHWFISTLSESDDLREMWSQEARDRPKQRDCIFYFNGSFEWLYAFLRLALAAPLARRTSSNLAARVLF
jgi:hypothetical protein